LTIPDVVHVVDSGLIKESSWDSATRTEGLQTRWHSQAGCKQRWGRAGRNRPGIAHQLYTKEQFESFELFTRPAIVREALDDTLIKATRAGVTDFDSFEWLDPPDKAEVDRVRNVVSARHLTDSDGDPTKLGSEIFDVYQRIGRYLGDGAGSSARTLDMASLLLLADRYD
jgi:HrpA-like RNA helicase